MAAKVITTCKTCNRAVWTTDVDGAGNCCYCVRPNDTPLVPGTTGESVKAQENSQKKGWLR